VRGGNRSRWPRGHEENGLAERRKQGMEECAEATRTKSDRPAVMSFFSPVVLRVCVLRPDGSPLFLFLDVSLAQTPECRLLCTQWSQTEFEVQRLRRQIDAYYTDIQAC
jgi:hypothetical protein